MHTAATGIHRRASRPRETSCARARTAALLAIGIALLAGSLATAPTPASATTGPEPPTPSRTATAATTVVTEPSGFSGTGTALVRGTKQRGAGVSVTASGAEVCRIEADDRTDWSCPRVDLPEGAGVQVVASERPPAGAARPATGRALIDVIRPPVLDGEGAYATPGLVTGTGRPGATVTVSVDGAVDARCARVPVDASTYWSCSLGSPSGRHFVRAQQSDPEIGSGRASAYSNVQDVLVDRDPPAAAVITGPAAGARLESGAVTVTGSGEEGASVDLYIDNVPACSVVVRQGAWACAVELRDAGDHEFRAVQRDPAGNFAAPSAAVVVSVAPPAEPSTRPRPVPSASASPAPAPSTETPSPGPAPAPERDGDDSTVAPPPAPDRGTPIFPRADGTAPTLREALTNWSAPTSFGSGLGSFADSVARNWYAAPLAGAVFVALVALPLRMLVTSVRDRVQRPHARITGRNRRPVRAADPGAAPAPRRRWTLPLLATALLVALSVGIGGEVRYLRLLVAIAAGLVVLNLVGGAVATRLGSVWAGLPARVRFLPLMLVAAAATALLSRWAALEPPVIAGMLVSAGFAVGVPARLRASVNLLQVGVVAAIGVLGWLSLDLLGATGAPASGSAPSGVWIALLTETLATLCLAGVGSALVLMLPVASLPGRAILEWSAPAWMLSTLLVASVVALVVIGPAPVTLLPWVVVALAFAAVSLAVWAYVRFVEPQFAN